MARHGPGAESFPEDQRRPHARWYHAHMAHRNFGSLRQLPSGRWQARYRPLGSKPAVLSFDTKPQAQEFLDTVKRLVETTSMTAEQIDELARSGGLNK